MKCPICNNKAEPDSLLCKKCDNDRLAAASYARIAAGTGLTYTNAQAYSEENWIAANTKPNKGI